MKRYLLATMLAASFGTTGCAPDAGEQCDHYMEVFKTDPERPAWTEDYDRCVERMENVKSRWGVNSYRREVECSKTANTSYKLRQCIEGEEKHFRVKI